MKMLKLYRALREGWRHFCRNGWLSVATVSVLALSLFVIGVAGAAGGAAHLLLADVSEKVNMSVYFNADVSREDIEAMRADIEKYKEVRSVRYVSRDDALNNLLESEGDDPDIRKALDEIGSNPLQDALIVVANDPNEYDIVARSLEQSRYAPLISYTNYIRNKEVIEKVGNTAVVVQKIGLSLGMILLLIAVSITYNTIRMTIYANKREFEIMRLVGASNMYIKTPTLFEGVLYGLFAGFAAAIFFYAGAYFAAPIARAAFPNADLFLLSLGVWWVSIPLFLVVGVLFGVMSSWIAIERYLKA